MTSTLHRRVLAEALGTAFLAMAVVGSGIAAQRLSPRDIGLQPFENAAGTAAAPRGHHPRRRAGLGSPPQPGGRRHRPADRAGMLNPRIAAPAPANIDIRLLRRFDMRCLLEIGQERNLHGPIDAENNRR